VRSDDVLRVGPLEIRPSGFLALVNGRALRLTRLELRLLAELAKRPNCVLERAEIYEAVWGRAMEGGDRWVDNFVRRLRAKLRETHPGWAYIHTHRRVGYRLAPEFTGSSQGGHVFVTGFRPAPETLAASTRDQKELP
jgi:DNA-binding response OmpR family regulator